ncbi:MAG TPA: N-acetylmuramoyl-L-alanine amidase [Azoarcus sp.]|nr:N-acetylmuramoyl-L-alanine amidase [Azoarcus sp.]
MRSNNDAKPAAPFASVNTPAGFTRRDLLQFAGASLALLISPVGIAASTTLAAVRIWPGTEYTRITLEAPHTLNFKHMMLSDPDRLVIDLEGVAHDTVVRSLSDKVLAADPLIRGIRTAINRPGVVRVVIDLKESIKPQVFTLKPIASYGHRLVIDLYPSVPADPLLALINDRSTSGGTTTGGGSRQVATQPRVHTIVLDPGHGGEDPGAIGRRGSYEKNIVLSIAMRLKKLIDAEPDMRAVLTRNGDYFVPLYNRVSIARRAQADLFVSIHADAFVRPEANGSSVYVLSEKGATSTAAKWLAQKENESDLVGGVNITRQEGHLARTLLDLSQTATINDSLKLGSAVLGKIGNINRLHKPRVEQAAFAVLRSPDIPSILVETAFISNPDEERRLNDQGYQDKIAKAVFAGIRQYIASTTPGTPTTTIAQAE